MSIGNKPQSSNDPVSHNGTPRDKPEIELDFENQIVLMKCTPELFSFFTRMRSKDESDSPPSIVDFARIYKQIKMLLAPLEEGDEDGRPEGWNGDGR